MGSFFKKGLEVLSLCLVFVFFSACSFQLPMFRNNTDSTAIQSYRQYTNASENIKFSYPADWTVKKGYMGSTVMMLAPVEDNADVFQENFSLTIQDISSQPMNLDQYTNLSLDQLPQNIKNFNLVSKSTSQLLNTEGDKVVYTGTQNTYDLKFMQNWTIKGNKAYIATYSAQPDKFDKYIKNIEEMIKSMSLG